MFARNAGRLETARVGVCGLLVTFLLPLSAAQAAPRAAGEGSAPLADRTPANAILYVGWHGAEGLAPAYDQSRLKAVVDATDWDQLFHPFLPRVIERIEKENKDAAQAIRVALRIGKPMWQHPTAFYFGGIDWHGKNEPPTAHAALLCQAGPDAAALEQELKDAVDEGMKQMPAQVPGGVKVVRIDDIVAIAIGGEDNLLAKGAKSLANDPAFKSAMSHVNKDPVAAGYVNFDRFRKTIDSAVEKQGDEDARNKWPKVRDASGIDGLSSVAWACGFDDKEWAEEAFVSAPAPRKGLLELMDEQPISEEAVQLIPQTATLAGVASCDAGRCLNVLRSFVGEVDPGARDALDAFLKRASEHAGEDLEQDLSKGLGNQWVYYADPRTGGRGVMGMVLVNHLKDAAKAEQGLVSLEKLANSTIADQTKNQMVKVSFLTTRSGDLTVHYLGSPLISPAWTIHEGNLYVALFPQVAVSATDHAVGKGKSVLENRDFAAMRTRLGVDKPTSFQFMDLPRTAPDAYPQWLMVSRVSGFGDLFGVPSPAMLAPPLSRLLPQLTAAGSVTWVDHEGLHSKAVSPFPGANALATDPFSTMGLQPLIWGAAVPAQMKGLSPPPEPEPVKPVEPRIEEPKISPLPEIPKIAPPDIAPPPRPRQ